jgi:two-component system, chemotaxis family, response regulator Rcp1
LHDLNLRRKDRRIALEEIKGSPHLRRISVDSLTASHLEDDFLHLIDMGIAGYITKPNKLDGFVEAIITIDKYWFQIVELPSE